MGCRWFATKSLYKNVPLLAKCDNYLVKIVHNKTFKYYLHVLENITCPLGIVLLKNSLIQAERVFQILKEDYGFR
ncbi:hypothetical protein A8F94_18565 [Bacillus sp. FJAT-27225]|nr:hypothetical protein A8F94_18565 [Bacillus sp. FJAT-27225]